MAMRSVIFSDSVFYFSVVSVHTFKRVVNDKPIIVGLLLIEVVN